LHVFINRLNRSGFVNVRAPNGTYLSFSCEGREWEPDHGILTRKGDFGNLPAGEVFVAPVENSVNPLG